MESTGHYHYPILKKLYDEGIYVSVVNMILSMLRKDFYIKFNINSVFG